MTPPLWQKVRRNWRASWWKWKRRVKSWLKTQHSENKDHGVWSHHFMAKQRKTILGGSKITADGDCSHEIKRHLLLGRKSIRNLDSILKSRDNILLINFHLVRAMVFPVVMYVATGLEKVSFHSNPKERQCKRMFELLHNCTHLTH